MNRFIKLRAELLAATILLGWAVFAAPAQGVIVSTTNGNTTPDSLNNAGGPGNLFNNVAQSSTGGASAVYLGNGWMISARHEAIGTAFGQIRLPSGNYDVIDSSITFLKNPNNTNADLQMFRIANPPSLPTLAVGSSTPSGLAVMIGNGVSTTGAHFWDVDKSSANWVWTEGAEQSNATVNQYGGFSLDSTHIIRWGNNQIVNTLFQIDSGGGLTTLGLSTAFDSDAYTHISPTSAESQATNGDSGGAVFTKVGANWILSGIMLGTSMTLNNQPANTALFGDVTYFADLSFYRAQIMNLLIVPEPSSIFVAGTAMVALATVGLRHRRRQVQVQ